MALEYHNDSLQIPFRRPTTTTIYTSSPDGRHLGYKAVVQTAGIQTCTQAVREDKS